MSMEIALVSPLTVTKLPAQTVDLASLVVERLIDMPQDKSVYAKIAGVPDLILIIASANYDTCGTNNDGQWTDTDAVNLIKAYFGVA